MNAQTIIQRQNDIFCKPHKGVAADINAIYKKGVIRVGWPHRPWKSINRIARPNTIAIVGVALGDEGKGRLVDNTLSYFLHKKNITHAYVIRYHGGSNAGHTIEINNERIALHQIPSSVLFNNAQGIMDRGMVIHVQDLLVEIEDLEKKIPDICTRLHLSPDAILCTDLERAEEYLNGIRQNKTKGGTGRGISPSYADHYSRKGMHVYDLFSSHWIDSMTKQYLRYQKKFARYDLDLAKVPVIDFRKTRDTKQSQTRLLGSEKEFITRLSMARNELLKRNILTDTFPLHRDIFCDKRAVVIFEGAQSLGLHPWIGTRPDVTSSDTSIASVASGTAFWRPIDIGQKIGVFKATYTSSVGVRRMPTHADNEWSRWVRKVAHEYGTTTGRPRDVIYLDLAFLTYNARMTGVDVLAATHLDIARENENIHVCTHYTKKGSYVPYQPGLHHIAGVTPQYVELPGWDGTKTQNATKPSQLPKKALQFLSFIQKRTGYPIVAATTGPDRHQFVSFRGYTV